MGTSMGVLSAANWVPCLCSSATCLLCSCCPNSRSSTVTRVIYASILLLGTVLSCAMLSPGIDQLLKRVPGFCVGGAKMHTLDLQVQLECEKFLGYKAVYRICFGLSLSFLLLAIITFNVKTSRDPRAAIHNGFWFFKLGAMAALITGAFYIPDGLFQLVWFAVGCAGALLFIIIQLVLLVDFTHSWNESWVGRMESGSHCRWYAALLVVTMFNYVMYVVAAVTSFNLYAKPEACILNKLFIIFNVLLCLTASFISVLHKVQESQPRSGLLQSSIISLYTMYLTWSAMTSEPDRTCNPNLFHFLAPPTAPPPQVENQTWVMIVDDDDLMPTLGPLTPHLQWWDVQKVVGLGIFVLCILFSSIRSSSTSQVNKLTMASKDIAVQEEEGGAEESPGPRRVRDNEQDLVQYNYCVFHSMLVLASLYIMMTLTDWYSPYNPSVSLSRTAVWVKMASSWACLMLYIWTLVAPMILTGRDFS